MARWIVASRPPRQNCARGRAQPAGTPSRAAGGRLLVADDQVLVEPVEHSGAAVLHRYQVLDPDPEPARQVDAGLDGHDVADYQRVGGAPRQVRRLVDLQADPMTEPVAEALPIPAFVDDRPRNTVNLGPCSAWLHRL